MLHPSALLRGKGGRVRLLFKAVGMMNNQSMPLSSFLLDSQPLPTFPSATPLTPPPNGIPYEPAEPPEPVLPLFDGLKLDEICRVQTMEDLATAVAALSQEEVLGFDTEAKPGFRRGQADNDGPHLIQLATRHRKAFLFSITYRPQLPDLQLAMRRELQTILESPKLLKVGFSLSFDNRVLRNNMNIVVKNTLDLSQRVKMAGRDNRNTMGTATAAKLVLGVNFVKSKRITISNWSLPIQNLNERQVLYAANDAYVAIRVYDEWMKLQADATSPFHPTNVAASDLALRASAKESEDSNNGAGTANPQSSSVVGSEVSSSQCVVGAPTIEPVKG